MRLPDGRLIEYLHDPLGRRIAKKIDGAVVEKYLWQGVTRLLAVYDGADNLRMRFEYADGRMPVAMVKEGVLYYLCYDQVGSLRAVTDSAGNLVKTVAYDSFGYIIEDSSAGFTVPFGFAGGLHDRDTGLVRFGYRDYDPDLGRWTAKDPILFAGGDTDLYGYVLDDPVNAIDPSGLWRWHGNWGGPNWTGGQEGTWNTIDQSKALDPVDKQDCCYRDHDICYGSCRDDNSDNSCKSQARADCFKACDRKLASCLRNLGNDPSNNWKAKLAAEYFENSNPGAD